MIEKIAAQIKARLGAYSPETAVILGSGLGALGDLVENPVIIPYAEIELFCRPDFRRVYHSVKIFRNQA